MGDHRKLLRHFLAALAYRTQKALRDAPDHFASFSAGEGVRTPAQLVRHMTSVLGYSRTFFVGGTYSANPLPSFRDEVDRFHQMIEDLAGHLQAGTPLRDITPERLLQGPFADAMTHAGQLAMLRRLSGDPVAPENFVMAEIDPQRLGQDQAMPMSPDEIWPEAPKGWAPPCRREEMAIEIRRESPADVDGVRNVHVRAFGRETEADLVDLLRNRGRAAVAMVALAHGRTVGHILFSPVTVENAFESFRAAGLAPLAVLPDFQNHGIGSRLILTGLDECRGAGLDAVVVLGHPGYYPRFGFSRAKDSRLTNEYGADDSFMVVELKGGVLSRIGGLVRYALEFGEAGC
jgi:predicted N-acetyltransferase YhbS